MALWYFSQERSRLNIGPRAALAFVFTSLSPTDVFPRCAFGEFFVPYAIKAVPCILIWVKITYELVRAATGRGCSGQYCCSADPRFG